MNKLTVTRALNKFVGKVVGTTQRLKTRAELLHIDAVDATVTTAHTKLEAKRKAIGFARESLYLAMADADKAANALKVIREAAEEEIKLTYGEVAPTKG